jgi:hypothetical protein
VGEGQWPWLQWPLFACKSRESGGRMKSALAICARGAVNLSVATLARAGCREFSHLKYYPFPSGTNILPSIMVQIPDGEL